MGLREKFIRADGDRLPLIAVGVAFLLLFGGLGGLAFGLHLRGRALHLESSGIRSQARVTKAFIEVRGAGDRSSKHYRLVLLREDGVWGEFEVSWKQYNAWGQAGATVPILTDPDDKDYWMPETALAGEFTRAWLVMICVPALGVSTVLMMFLGLWYQYWRRRPGTGTPGAPYGSQTSYQSPLRR